MHYVCIYVCMEKKQHEPDHNLFPADYELLAEAFTIKKTPRI